MNRILVLSTCLTGKYKYCTVSIKKNNLALLSDLCDRTALLILTGPGNPASTTPLMMKGKSPALAKRGQKKHLVLDKLLSCISDRKPDCT